MSKKDETVIDGNRSDELARNKNSSGLHHTNLNSIGSTHNMEQRLNTYPPTVTIKQILQQTLPSMSFCLHGTKTNLIRIVAKVGNIEFLLPGLSNIEVNDSENNNINVIYFRRKLTDDHNDSTMYRVDRYPNADTNLVLLADSSENSGNPPLGDENTINAGLRSPRKIIDSYLDSELDQVCDFEFESQGSSHFADITSEGEYLYGAIDCDLRAWNSDDTDSNLSDPSRTGTLTQVQTSSAPVPSLASACEDIFFGAQRIKKTSPTRSPGDWSSFLEQEFLRGPTGIEETPQPETVSSSIPSLDESHEINRNNFVKCTGVVRNLNGKVIFFAKSLIKIKV